MKRAIGIFVLFFVTTLVFGQTQKMVLKTFNLEGNNYIELNFEGEVVLKEWATENAIRVQMEVTYHNTNSNMMKYLISKGRYNLVATNTETKFNISIPTIKEPVVVSKEGTLLEETIVYTVYLPQGVNAEIVNVENTKIVSNQ